MYIVVVEFTVKEADLKAFMPLMRQNAKKSVLDEPGCNQFDVCFDPKNATDVFLYEVYTDRQAFDAHLASSHFKTFDNQTAQMIERKHVRTLERSEA